MASYNNSCQQQFNLNFPQKKRQKNAGETYSGSDAFSVAFNVVLAEINNTVIQEKEVITLKSLSDVYVTTLRIRGFPQGYRSLWL